MTGRARWVVWVACLAAACEGSTGPQRDPRPPDGELSTTEGAVPAPGLDGVPSSGPDGGTGDFAESPTNSCAGDCPLFAPAFSVAQRGEANRVQWGPGIAFGDVDDDQRVDLVVLDELGVRFYLGDGRGSFAAGQEIDVPAAAGANLVDYDGDTDLDLFLVASVPGAALRMFSNDGSGNFSDISDAMSLPTVTDPAGAAWSDYDGDGDLDVFVAQWFEQPSLLLRNDGNSFVNVAEEVGVSNPTAAAYQGVWVDYDMDGDDDLFVANDKGQITALATSLFRNDDGVFTDVSTDAGIAERVHGMGIAAGDIDNDGDFDLYVTDIGLQDGGQLLYLNNGDGTFQYGAASWNALAETRFGWGTVFADFDNDADLDLLMADTGDDGPWMGDNRGDVFVDLSSRLGVRLPAAQFGLAVADIDGDGRLDLGWALRGEDAIHIDRNVVSQAGHYLRVRLSGSGANTRAIGAKVWVDAGTTRLLRGARVGGSFMSSSEPLLHFGLGDVESVDRIEVEWPSGDVSTYEGPFDADALVVLDEPS